MRRLRLALLSLVSLPLLPAGALLLFADGCGSDSAPGTATTDAAAVETGTESDGSADASNESVTPADGGALDAACAATKVVPSTGETCVGFGDGTGCDTACGLPKYGYVCFNGGPPGFAGCVQASSTGSFGDTYCCPDDKCVAQPDQDPQCAGSGKPHRYQCPPNGMGGNVAPPTGCADGGSGGTALERFYCCP
jgi:hypothetical protein